MLWPVTQRKPEHSNGDLVSLSHLNPLLAIVLALAVLVPAIALSPSGAAAPERVGALTLHGHTTMVEFAPSIAQHSGQEVARIRDASVEAYPPPDVGGCEDASRCSVAGVPIGEWLWASVRVEGASGPVAGEIVGLEVCYGDCARDTFSFGETDENGTARVLIPPIRDGENRISIMLRHSDFSRTTYTYAASPTRVEEVPNVVRLMPDDGWASAEFNITKPGYFRIELVAVPTSGTQDESSFRVFLYDHQWNFSGETPMRGGFFVAGATPPVRIGAATPLGSPDVEAWPYPARYCCSGGLRAVVQGWFSPGDVAFTTTILRAGLQGDEDLGIHVFALDSTAYALDVTGAGPATPVDASPSQVPSAALSAAGTGAYVGTFSAQLEAPAEHAILIGAAVPSGLVSVGGKSTITRDGEKIAGKTGPYGVAAVASGTCEGTWQAELADYAGHPHNAVGLVRAAGLELSESFLRAFEFSTRDACATATWPVYVAL